MPDEKSRLHSVLPSAYTRARSLDVGYAPVQQPDLQSRAFTRLFDAFGGNNPETRQRAISMADALSGDYGQFAISMTPLAGDAQTFMEAKRAMAEGKTGQAAMLGGAGLLGMVPVAGDLVGKAVKSAADWRQVPATSVPNEYFDEIMDSMGDYEVFGVRIIPRGYEVSPGDTLPNSKNWVDNIDTGEELDGVSTIGIQQEGDGEWAIRKLLSGGYDGDQVVLVGGKRKGYGDDDGEVLIGNPQVISAFSKPK